MSGALRRRLSRALPIAATAALLAPAGASAAVEIDSDPPLVPAFSANVSDYAVVCEGEPVRVSSSAARGDRVGVDGSRLRGGSRQRDVPLDYGQRFEIRVKIGSRKRTHHVRCLSPQYPEYEFSRERPPARELYATAPSLIQDPKLPAYAALVDDHGTPLWWHGGAPPALPNDIQVLSDGTVAFADAPLPNHAVTDGYQVRELDGTLIRRVKTVGSDTDPHELIELGGGRFIAMTYRPRTGVDLSEYGGPSDAVILDSEIQRLNRKGEMVWSWSSKDHIDLDETFPRWTLEPSNPEQEQGFEGSFDPTHLNSIDLLESGDMILSMRHTDSVYKIAGDDGRVIWKLGGTETPQSLDVIGDPQAEAMFGGQHDAREIRPGVITVHDNASFRNYAPRAVRYRIDEQAGTATLVEEITDPLAPSSFCCGSARRIDGGYWTLGWGGNPFSTEFDPRGRRTFTLNTPGLFTYRMLPVRDGLVRDRELRVGMDAKYPRRPPECERGRKAGPAGTLEGDRIRGGRRGEYIDGLAGSDVIRGARGADCLLGDNGADVLRGARGRDQVEGGRGSDELRGGRGADDLSGGPGDDTLRGGAGRDAFDCGPGSDTVMAERRDTVAANCERRIRA